MEKMVIPSKGMISAHLCRSMDDFQAIPLIDAINVEREKVGKLPIQPSDDMCATALIKGWVQKVQNIYHGGKIFLQLLQE